MKTIYKFKILKQLEKETIEGHIAMAIISTECIFSQAKVRLHAGYTISTERPYIVVIDASSDVGEHIAQVFTGMLIKFIGEDKFKVERVNKPPEAGEPAAQKSVKPEKENEA